MFFAFLPWVNFGTNSRDTQIWPLLFGLLFLLTSYRHKYNSKEISIASLPLLALVVWFFFSEKVMDFIALRAIISYLAFTVCFLAFTVFVKKYNFPFRKAYLITARIVNYAESKHLKFNDLTMKDLNKIDKNLDESVLEVFDLRNSIKSKKSYGGTSFENIKKMIKKYKRESK